MTTYSTFIYLKNYFPIDKKLICLKDRSEFVK